MACVTVANMRRKSLLHKLILLEVWTVFWSPWMDLILLQLILGTFSGTFILTPDPIYNIYLSTTAIFLFASWSLHNVIAWMKNKPLLSRNAGR